MPVITLPDGSEKTFDKPVSVYDVAASIGAGLAKAAIAGEVDGEAVDVSFKIDHDAKLKIITTKDEAGLEIIRHSCAHLLAQAVKQLFPTVQVTIGPVIENGFYYDFAFSKGFNDEDLAKIEAKMHEIAKRKLEITREEMTRDEAIKLFSDMGEEYKVKIIKDIPEDQTLSLYRQGDFIDLCRGPHLPNTEFLKAFKLQRVSGAFWRGDAKNEMLQRIYGTAFADKKALAAHLHLLEEAAKRDHRVIAKKLDIYHMQEEAPGMAFWHPNGWTLYNQLVKYIQALQNESGYQEINTPQIVDLKLWEASGHLSKYDTGIFTVESEARTFAVKPMSCPCHVQVFKQGLKSYRDLPIRYTEFGRCHRNEPSGALHGLMRVRNFTQDDGHIFCREAQIVGEVRAFTDQLFKTYHDFGFDDVIVRVSTRPEMRVGSDETWDKAEKVLGDALDQHGVEWEELPGEGAFYGPKIEYSLKDCLGRVWQCGTIQVDFSMPERLGASYIDEKGEKQIPVMLHRATFGSFERFLAILLEETAGDLPLWLAPIQVAILNISDQQAEYVGQITEKLQKSGFRVRNDLRNEKIGYKIREHTMARTPYLMIIGDREVEQQNIAVRDILTDKTEIMTLDDFMSRLQDQVENKTRRGGRKDQREQ